MARIVPPLPAASRPSNTTMARKPLCLTHAWSRHNSPWSLSNSFSYFFRFSLPPCFSSSPFPSFAIVAPLARSVGERLDEQLAPLPVHPVQAHGNLLDRAIGRVRELERRPRARAIAIDTLDIYARQIRRVFLH